ncbi:MAG: serine/threonine protein kinase [Synechococcales cyanobacterium RM1_1_8]|nr:serine/threonine protein kinase [Synechococcales cyanobacterium RM1_1_8]
MDNQAQDNLLSFRQSQARQSHLLELCGTKTPFRDRYQIAKAIGKGGFGITFLARDLVLPGAPPCVIKQLCPKINDAAALLRAQKRFEREAHTLGSLGGHAQIPTLLNYFEQDGEFFLVQEYIHGHTLSKLVKYRGAWSEAAVRGFLKEILPILDYIHRSQVIHRDVKPPNIMRCRCTGRLVLLDFGAVKEFITLEARDTAHVPTTHFVGTMGFAPPEQLALRATFATDVYAVGVTCIFLLTGKSPAKMGVDPHTGGLRWRDQVSVSAPFARLLEKMTSISLRDRYKTAAQVLKMMDVEELRDELELCMHRREPEPLPVNTPSYVSPSARMAASIRGLRDRRSTPAKSQWNLRPGDRHQALMYSR